MSTLGRLGLFAAALVAVFVAAVGVGRATGPVGPVGPAAPDPAGERRVLSAGSALPGGLATSQDGYTLVVDQAIHAPGTRELAFRVEDAAGGAVTDYEVEHDKTMHLVAVRRDLTGFQHVHPELDPAGTWRVQLELSAGSWRVLADFVPTGGEGLTLGTDLLVPGAPELAPDPPPTTTATVDGYTVTLSGDLVAGEHAALGLLVSRDGEPVTDLEPYLGAYGHLVALREVDLGYLHVHPEDGLAGPTVEFGVEVPSAGRYRLFLDFRHGGVVRTAAFTVEADHGADHGADDERDGTDHGDH